MGIVRKVLVINADDVLAKSLEEGLKDSVYELDISPLYLESIEKLKSVDYDFVFVCVNGVADIPLIKDTSRKKPDSRIVVITRQNPKSEVDWGYGNSRTRLCDYLHKSGVVLVVGKDELAGEESNLPLCLDSIFISSPEEYENP